MISSKIIAAFSEMYADLVNTQCGENGEPFNVTEASRRYRNTAEI
jgi:hypothetical protein